MKTPATATRRPGFTLVELLVVIAIIVVLAALALAAVAAAMNKAKKTQALHVCTSLVQAINNYYDTYGGLPDMANASEDHDIDTTTAEGATLLNILMGLEAADDANAKNPKKIRFFECKEAKKSTPPTEGVRYVGDVVDGLWDPWGKAYLIRLDTDYNETMPDPFNAGSKLRGVKVLVYTKGKNDKADGGKGDDVKSW